MAAKKSGHPPLEHPALDQLAATPDIVRALLSGVSDAQTLWKPAPERYSIAELLEHLSHVEGHCFRLRFDKTLASDNPELEPYDQNAFYAAGIYSGRDAEESLAHWEEQREDNLEFLRGLEANLLLRNAHHAILGSFSLTNLLNQWALHDLGHIRQLAELVRAQVYFPHVGPFQADYILKP
ncbi:MAG: DinB family protein [Acidobacteriota bacterium]|nr:DinB family protein [Acidobacteriota bacterium]